VSQLYLCKHDYQEIISTTAITRHARSNSFPPCLHFWHHSLVSRCNPNSHASALKREVLLALPSPHRPEWLCGSNSLLFERRLKRPPRKADRSPLCRDEIKNACCFTSALPTRIHGMLFGYRRQHVNDRTTSFSPEWNTKSWQGKKVVNILKCCAVQLRGKLG